MIYWRGARLSFKKAMSLFSHKFHFSLPLKQTDIDCSHGPCYSWTFGANTQCSTLFHIFESLFLAELFPVCKWCFFFFLQLNKPFAGRSPDSVSFPLPPTSTQGPFMNNCVWLDWNYSNFVTGQSTTSGCGLISTSIWGYVLVLVFQGL